MPTLTTQVQPTRSVDDIRIARRVRHLYERHFTDADHPTPMPRGSALWVARVYRDLLRSNIPEANRRPLKDQLDQMLRWHANLALDSLDMPKLPEPTYPKEAIGKQPAEPRIPIIYDLIT